jgi:starvation-inducible DNA-binding protein
MKFSDELIATARIVLANTTVMYFKAHSYHWNIEGKDFSQLHDFFGDIYEEVYGAVDQAAEEIRTLDEYAPISLAKILEETTVAEDESKPETAELMLTNLLDANEEVMTSLNKLFTICSDEDCQGLANWAADRLDIHSKHRWMIRSHLRG